MSSETEVRKEVGNSPSVNFEELTKIYLDRYYFKTNKEQKGDILLYGLMVAAIENLDPVIPVSIQRLAEITFSEVQDMQEHLPLLLEVFPFLGTYYVKQQTFVKS